MDGLVVKFIFVVLCCYIPYCDAAVYSESCDTTNVCTGNGVVCVISSGTTGTCGCDPTGYFTNGVDGCIAEVGYGCQQTSECSTGAVCMGSLCVCTSDNYDSIGTCQPKVEVGVSCAATDACLDSYAECLSPGSSMCTCKSGYVESGTSNSCVTDYCINNQCQNGGTCVNGVSVYTCDCWTGISGDSCQTKASLGAECPQPSDLSNSCTANNAECVLNNGYKCRCESDYYDTNGATSGGFCNLKVNVGSQCATTDACLDANAECLSPGVSSVCTCQTGYVESGTSCATDYCQNIVCQNGGTCNNGVSGYTCSCLTGINGNLCQTKASLGAQCPSQLLDSCTDNNAECVNNKCQCKSDYYDTNGAASGGTCLQNYCQNIVCQNGGTCNNGVSGYTCSCLTGINGNLCQTKASLGAQCPSQLLDSCTDNNAECVNNKCQCKSDYYDTNGADSGGTCLQNYCLNIQCQNGGTCNNGVSGYTCSCLTGISGDNCQTKASLGAVCPQQSQLANSCSDTNANCVLNNGYKCQCKSSFYDNNGATLGGGTCLLKVSLGYTGCSTDFSVTDSCTDTNAQCVSGGSFNVCQCKSEYYDDNGSQQEGTCQRKKDLGDTCDNVNQCSDSSTKCSGTCQCVSTHYDSDGTSGTGGSCVQKKVVGDNCPGGLGPTASCSDTNAECSQVDQTSTYTCQCKSTHYDNNGGNGGGTCTIKKVVGDNCPGGLGPTASCSDTNAECSQVDQTSTYTCRCKSTHYDNNGGNGGGTCTIKISLGGGCPGNLGLSASCYDTYGECSVVGQTSNYKCQCKSTHYDNNGDTGGGTCTIRKTLQNSCDYYFSAINDQCSDPNALCTGSNPGSCTCDQGFHPDSSTCKPNKALGVACDPLVPGECSDPNAQCLGNTTASLCTCGTQYYKYNNNGVYICSPVSQLQVTNIQFTSVTTSSFSASWSAPAGKSDYIDKYSVEWRPKGNSVAGNSVDTPSTSTPISTGLTSGQAYTVNITSVNTGTQSGSNRYTSTTKEQALVPLTPNGFYSSGNDLTVSNDRITVRWAASAGFVRQYVFVMKDGGTEKRKIYPASAEAIPSFAGMKNGYTYNIVITALSQLFDDGKYLSSETYSFTLKTTVQAPSQPNNIECTETNIFDNHILLTWGEPTYPNGDLVQYIVEVFVYPQTTVQQTYNTSSTNTSFDVKNLNPGSLYTFKVKTQNELYTSSAGTLTGSYCTTRAKMADVPENLLTTDITSRGMKIEWDKPINVYSAENLGYVLQIKAGTNCAIEQVYRCSDCRQTFQLNDLTELCASKRLAEIPQTTQELDSTLLFTTSALDPDTVYTVSVTAINNAGRGNAAIVTPKTLEEEPQKPFNVGLSVITSTTVVVEWRINGPRPGVTTYTIIVEPVDTAALTVTRPVQGFTNTSYKVTGLEEFWNYTVKVKVATSIGEQTSDASSQFKTLAAAPGPVDAFNITTPDGDYTKLKITWKTPTALEKNGIIKDFKFTHNATELSGSTDELGSPETFDVESLDSHVYEKTVMVQPENTYTFEVYAVNEDNQPGLAKKETKMAPAGVPKNDFEDLEQKKVIPSDKVAITGQTSFKIVVDSGFLAQTTYGAITLSGLLICTDCTSLTGKNSIDLDVYRTYPNYDAASGSGDPYRPTKDSWVTDQAGVTGRRKRAAADEIEYTVGVESCSNTGGYCNGPLKPNTQYSVHVVACTSGGCLLSNSYGPFITEAVPDESNLGPIIGGVVGGVVAVAVIAGIIFFVMRRRNKNPKMTHMPMNGEDNATFVDPAITKIPRKRPVRLSEFDTHLQSLHKDTNLLFSSAYEDLKTLSPTHPQEAANREENRLKNRYINILPFDHSRVKLFTNGEDDREDYINANYLPGYKSQREYIGCQGPIPGTIDDFWRMIWEQNVSVIVMLTLCKEGQKVKCEQYWPNDVGDPKQYGDVIVEVTSSSTIKTYDYKMFKLGMGNKSRTVKHFHFLSWLDFQANVQHDIILDFIEHVRQQVQPPDTAGPMIVHCSAGVGRTGTYIVLDHLKQYIRDHDFDVNIDIFDMVLSLRDNRPHMVQTEQQYVFIHDCVKELLDKKRQEENIYQNNGFQEENIYQNEEPQQSLYANVDIGSSHMKTEL